MPTSEPPTPAASAGDREPLAEPLAEDPTVLLTPRLDSPTVPLHRPATPAVAASPTAPDAADPAAAPSDAAEPPTAPAGPAVPDAGSGSEADLGRAPDTRRDADRAVAHPAVDPADVPIAADGPTVRLRRPPDAPDLTGAAPTDGSPGAVTDGALPAAGLPDDASADPGPAAGPDGTAGATPGGPDADAPSGAPGTPVPVPPRDPDPVVAGTAATDPAAARTPDGPETAVTPAARTPDDAAAADVELPPTRTRPERGPLSAGSVLIAVLLALFGFVLVVQLRSTDADEGLSAARQEDLVRILSDLQAREQRLNDDIAALEATRQQLASGVEGRQAALAEAQRRANELGLLAGTLPARGPGLKMTVIGAEGKPVKAAAMLNAVQELRGAGCEVIQLTGSGGTAVRVIASTAFVEDGNGLLVGGTRLTGPYELTVIGSPKILVPALNIAGGAVTGFERDGGTVNIVELDSVEVTATREPADLKYARPVS